MGWDNRGVAVYTEDGNEMFNVISNNVFICHDIYYCKIQWQLEAGPGQKEGGIFMFGMRNDVIGNHVVGHDNGMWTPGLAQPDGRHLGFSLGLVCNQFIPFGKIKGNVFHDCQRFGTYVDHQFPRNVEQTANGLVTEVPYGPAPSCEEFYSNGEDNGLKIVVEDQFDWHNQFSGGYYFGDISFVRFTSVNNYHSIYWKFSKNFADMEGIHLQDSIFANDPKDPIGQLKLYLPGGSFTFRMKNCTFVGGPFLPDGGVLNSPQNCGRVDDNDDIPGSLCGVQISMEDCDFSEVLPFQDKIVHTSFGASDGSILSAMYISQDSSLGGHKTIVSPFLNGFADVPGCSGPDETYSGYACDQKIRRLNIWAPNMDELRLQGPGYNVAPNDDPLVLGANAGVLHYTKDQGHMHSGTKMLAGGYSANVIVGEEYVLEGLHWTGDIVVDFSDSILPDLYGEDRASERITLTIKTTDGGSLTCNPNAGDSRLFHGADHIDVRALRSGNMGDCSEQYRKLAGEELGPTMPTIAPSGECGCDGAEYDPSCPGSGCMACGKPHCRYCGEGWQPCKFTTGKAILIFHMKCIIF